MIYNNLYDEVLIKPATSFDVDTLNIVSGFATPAMVIHHLQGLDELNKNHVKINLIIGMSDRNIFSKRNFEAYKSLMIRDIGINRFYCKYIKNRPYVHSKVYVWTKENDPVCSFIGSANYTQMAFVNRNQQEVMGQTNNIKAKRYFDLLNQEDRSISILDAVPEFKFKDIIIDSIGREMKLSLSNLKKFDHVTISFINSKNEISRRSSLNWGQRDTREPNQAYIPLKSDISKSDFFPPRQSHFTVFTDDGKSFVCSRAQDNGKAIHTPHNNSLIGIYFRERLGVPLGDLVTMEHFQRYGRTDLDFFKIDDEQYFMDFSVKINSGRHS
jgi:hypothetical protein